MSVSAVAASLSIGPLSVPLTWTVSVDASFFTTLAARGRPGTWAVQPTASRAVATISAMLRCRMNPLCLPVGSRGVLLVELRRIQRPTCGGLIRFTGPKSIGGLTFPRVRELLFAAVLLLGPPTSPSWPGADPTLPGCTGGIVPNSDHNGAIAGPGTTDVSLAAIPQGIYDLSVWAGSTRPGPATAIGLRFLDPAGIQTGRTYARWPQQTKRYNTYGMIAPRNAATVRFFATTTTEIHWSCVFLRVSAYELGLETQGDQLRITITNTGNLPLTNLRLSVPACTGLDAQPFDLKDQAVRTCTGTPPATATVSGALYWNGALPDRSVSLEHALDRRFGHHGLGLQLDDRQSLGDSLGSDLGSDLGDRVREVGNQPQDTGRRQL